MKIALSEAIVEWKGYGSHGRGFPWRMTPVVPDRYFKARVYQDLGSAVEAVYRAGAVVRLDEGTDPRVVAEVMSMHERRRSSVAVDHDWRG